VSKERVYLSTTIPYVNAPAHLGHALELVQADVLARHHRLAGDQVRFQTGTDDNSLKNVLAAAAEGVSTAELVGRNAAAFERLREPLALSFDDFIRTSSDPRHRPGVERLWRACAASGDLYQKDYEGLYCVGCEQFYKPAELAGRACPEHGTQPQRIREENWFFRLSRYERQLHDLIAAGRLRIEPAARRNEVLGFIADGLEDFSASRSISRARGWGIPVPDDPDQVIYVWWDALGNYVTALGYGGDAQEGDAQEYERWWVQSDRRVHLAGKGVVRFHAVFWPAILLSAGLPLPTDILVHDYLTIDGRKISKSAGVVGPADGAVAAADGAARSAAADGAAGSAAGVAGSAAGVAGSAAGVAGSSADPAALIARFGTDAVRWWLLREVPRVGDADFTVARLIARANEDLANGLGNLVSRVISMAHRYRQGQLRPLPAHEFVVAGASQLRAACTHVTDRVSTALAAYDIRAATVAIWDIVDEANRYIERAEPWRLASAERAGDASAGFQLDAALDVLIQACRTLAAELAPFVPGLAARLAAACDDSAGPLPEPRTLFPRIG
jgi:methionyl-tRNA synthetase